MLWYLGLADPLGLPLQGRLIPQDSKWLSYANQLIQSLPQCHLYSALTLQAIILLLDHQGPGSRQLEATPASQSPTKVVKEASAKRTYTASHVPSCGTAKPLAHTLPSALLPPAWPWGFSMLSCWHAMPSVYRGLEHKNLCIHDSFPCVCKYYHIWLK